MGKLKAAVNHAEDLLDERIIRCAKIMIHFCLQLYLDRVQKCEAFVLPPIPESQNAFKILMELCNSPLRWFQHYHPHYTAK